VSAWVNTGAAGATGAVCAPGASGAQRIAAAAKNDGRFILEIMLAETRRIADRVTARAVSRLA